MKTIKSFLGAMFANTENIRYIDTIGTMTFEKASFVAREDSGMFVSVGTSKAIVCFSLNRPSIQCHAVYLVIDDSQGELWAYYKTNGKDPAQYGLTYYRPSPILSLAVAC